MVVDQMEFKMFEAVAQYGRWIRKLTFCFDKVCYEDCASVPAIEEELASLAYRGLDLEYLIVSLLGLIILDQWYWATGSY